jgi:ABC-2 type transport system ATP-binding protein
MIEAKDLTKRFGNTLAVDTISFTVNQGEIVGLLGPNGAGKTTTMRILTGYLTADSGTATILGKDVLTQSLEVRRAIGYLPENNPLYTEMGVVDYLKFIAQIRQIPRKKIKSQTREMIEMCGLETVLNKKIDELSKGFRQRVGLAQAMIHNPAVLIFDEPTVGLDPNQIVEIRELIKRIGAEKTVILSSHILPEVSATCKQIIIMNRGRIVASGTPEEMSSRARGGGVVTMVVRGPVEHIKDKLNTMKKVKKFAVQGTEANGSTRFEIISAGEEDINEDLFRMVVENGWVLSELHQETLSLEDVFQQLTLKES